MSSWELRVCRVDAVPKVRSKEADMDTVTFEKGYVTLHIAVTEGESRGGNPQLKPSQNAAEGWPPHRLLKDTTSGNFYPLYGSLTVGLKAAVNAPATTRQDTPDIAALIADAVSKALAANVSQPVKRGRPVGSKNKVVSS